jgi:HSP20 family protein
MMLFPIRKTMDVMFCDDLKSDIDLYDNLFTEISRDALVAEPAPKIDMSEGKKNIVIRAELPGMDAKDIELSVTNGIVTISGEKRYESESEEMNSFCRETSYGYFKRSMELPNDVDEKKVKAEYKDGILKVVLPKSEPRDKKLIKVEAA